MKAQTNSACRWSLAGVCWPLPPAAPRSVAPPPPAAARRSPSEDAAKMKAVGAKVKGQHRLVQLARWATTTCSS